MGQASSPALAVAGWAALGQVVLTGAYFATGLLWLSAAGAFCMAGVSGPASGNLKLHLLATVGYALLFPAACLVLWLRIRRRRADVTAT